MPLTRQEALDYFQSPDLIGLGFEADAVRRRLHPEGVVTYIIDRNINYTNFCTEYCTFCAFYPPPPQRRQKHPPLRRGLHLSTSKKSTKRSPRPSRWAAPASSCRAAFTPTSRSTGSSACSPASSSASRRSGSTASPPLKSSPSPSTPTLDLRTTIVRLRDAGLDSIPGGGAEILDDEVRFRIARLKCRTEDWVSVHRTAHQLGMRTTATMMFGVGETFDQRINHFEVVRRLQEETGGFTAFIPWSFQPHNTALGGRGWDEATSVEYLKVLAIARLYLDNIENVQASWVTQGLKVLELGLHFGGNDVGSVMLEENVVKAAGTSNCTTEEELRRIIRDAGFKPVQRDTLYRTMFLN